MGAGKDAEKLEARALLLGTSDCAPAVETVGQLLYKLKWSGPDSAVHTEKACSRVCTPPRFTPLPTMEAAAPPMEEGLVLKVVQT